MNIRLTTGGKALLLGSLICLSTCALALPSPKDIQASVEAGQFTQAEAQLREVLRDKPNSARAHYELGEVLAREGRYLEAELALRQAQKLEPSLKFASSPDQFNALMRKLEAQTRTPAGSLDATSPIKPVPMTSPSPALDNRAVTYPAAPAPRPAPSGSSLPWGWVLLGLGALAALAVWLRRAATVQQVPAAPVAYPVEPQGFGRDYTAAPPAYPAYPSAASASGMGSTVKGAVVGGLAGVAAGYALSKVLEDHERPADLPHSSPDLTRTGGSYTALDDVPDRPDLGAFDAGSGDGWDNGDAGGSGGGSDEW